MGIVTSLLGSLGSIAAMLGIQKVTDLVGTLKAQAKGVSELDIIDIVNTMYNEASKKGNAAINTLTNKLNAVPFGSYSGKVRDVINNHKNNLRNRIQKVETTMNDINSRAQGIERKANTLMMMSNDYRSSEAGQSQVQQLKDDVGQLLSDANLVEKSIKEK